MVFDIRKIKIPATLDHWLDQRAKQTIFTISLFLIAACGVVDYWVVPALSFSLFYIGPIALAAWYAGRRWGLLVGVIAALVWYYADVLDEGEYVFDWIPIWNSMIRLGFFTIIASLLGVLRARLKFEESLADTDPLTGLANRRRFIERIEAEMERMKRYTQPFTIAYIDLDNFKAINDTLGHDAGDGVLRNVAIAIRTHMRQSDVAARLGGDEFAGLFPVANYDAAGVILKKMHNELTATMDEKTSQVTFSIGAITFEKPMTNTRDMVKAVDDLMYSVKKAGKNNLSHVAWVG